VLERPASFAGGMFVFKKILLGLSAAGHAGAGKRSA